MPYHIYHSDAIIVEYENRGESDRDILAFTKVHGLVRLSAKSIRKRESKLRYTLLPFRIVHIDYIRAKYGWKITSAMPNRSFTDALRDKNKRNLIALQFRLLKRMVHGEERHHKLYDHLVETLEVITRLSDHNLSAGELLLTMKLLNILGYWGDDMPHTLQGEVTQELLDEVSRERKELVPLVNSALRMTHL